MKAAVFTEHGGPEVVHTADVAVPEPGPGEVLIQVKASSVNHLDLWARRGLPFPIPMPHIGGSDVAGTVAEVGPGVQGVEGGTPVVVDPSLDWEWYEGVRRGEGLPEPRFQVLGEHTQGGFAEYAVAPLENLFRVPEGVSLTSAAAAALVSVTAWRGLMTRGGLRPGERVLITGASGGVSTMAVQMARRAGATVFAVTSGKENVARVQELGGHVVLDRHEGELGELLREATGPRGVDLVLDSVGEVIWDPLLKCLAPGGRLVTYGATAGPTPAVDIRRIFWKQLSILGTTMGSPTEFRAAMGMVFRREVEPVIQEILPLDDVRRAHELLEEGGVFGKLVVVP